MKKTTQKPPRKRSSLPKLSQEAKTFLYFCIIVILVIFVSIFFIKFYLKDQQKSETDLTQREIDDTRTPILDRQNEAQNIDITISDKISPSKFTVEASKDYNLRIIKTLSAKCNTLENKELDYYLPLQDEATRYPITIPQKGIYELSCQNNPDLKLVLEAK